MEKFHATVHCAVTILKKFGYHGDLQSSENLRRIVEKLPTEMRRDWGEHIMKIEPERPSIVHLDAWLRQQVRIALNYASVSREQPGSQQKSKGNTILDHVADRTTLATEAPVSTYSECVCCGVRHGLHNCPTFTEMSVDDRAAFVAQHRCCFYCLKPGHRVSECRYVRVCTADGCSMRHHTQIHGSKRVTRERAREAYSAGSDETVGDRIVAVASGQTPSAGSLTLLQIVPVKIIGPQGKTRITCALLDPGAQTSICCRDLLDDLDIRGEDHELRLQNVEGCGPRQMSRKVSLTLEAVDGDQQRISVCEAFSVPRINITVQHIRKRKWKEWTHLHNLNLPDCSDKKVELLLGANVLEAVVQQDVRMGAPGQPVAIKTAFGWTLTGTTSGFAPERRVLFVRGITEEDRLCNELQTWWKTESFGTKYDMERPLSVQDRCALDYMDKMTRKHEGRYEACLLWKNEHVNMPDNRKMALQRLKSLERSLARHEDRASAYREQMSGYITKGYAQKVTADEASEPCKKRWFLPHHAVVHPAKSKIRIVFDAAAEWRGVSLNSELITGPDLLLSLCGILMRFREERVALVADVREMFHQVRISPGDRPALSFLWRDLDDSRQPDVYEMTVTIFGAKCSPAVASYALRRTADEYPQDTALAKAAASAVKKHFYMDDFLKSEPTVADAKNMQAEVSKLLTSGGFRLTKWMSNDPDVLEDIPVCDRAHQSLELSSLGHSEVRTLGCVWNPDVDDIGIQCREVNVPNTKRGVLRCTASVFDPLGIVAPYTLQAKMLIQHLWSQNCGWDD